MLSKERRNVVAYAALTYHNRHKGLELGPKLRREIGNRAKAIGIPFEEALAFAEEMARDVHASVFANPKGGPVTYLPSSSFTQRKGEIAYLTLKHWYREGGVRVDNGFRKGVGRVAAETGVPFEDLIEVLGGIIRSVMEDVLADTGEDQQA